MSSRLEISVAELGRVVTGKTPSTKNQAFFGGQFQFVTPSDLNFNHYYCHSTGTTVTEDAKAAQANQFIPGGAVMFTCIGNTIGKCAISSEECLTNQQINSVIPHRSDEAKFIYYLLINNIEIFRNIGFSGGVATPIINKTTFSNVRLRVPARELWKDIGEQLSNYDELIENNRRRVGALERTARLLYREWFSYLRFPGHEHATSSGHLPEGWQQGTISDFYDTASGGTPSRKKPDYYTGDINWVKTQELLDGFIFETDEKITEQAVSESSAKIFPADAVLVAMYGATIGQLGILAKPAATNQACCALIPKADASHYLYAYLFLAENKNGLVNLSQGAAQNNISQQIIKGYPMVFPSDEIMTAFVDLVEPIFKLKKVIEAQIASLSKARDFLLPRLMNGDITV